MLWTKVIMTGTSPNGMGEETPDVIPDFLDWETCYGQSHNTYALIDVMTKVFHPKGKRTARAWGKGLIIFSFERTKDKDWVMSNQPWHFDGSLFAIRELLGMEQPSTIEISPECFWVRVYDIPIDTRTDTVI